MIPVVERMIDRPANCHDVVSAIVRSSDELDIIIIDHGLL